MNRVLNAEHDLAARLALTRSDASEWRHVPDKLEGLKLGIAKSDGNRYYLHAGFEAVNQRYQPDYGIPSLGDRPVDVPHDRQFCEAGRLRPARPSTCSTRCSAGSPSRRGACLRPVG